VTESASGSRRTIVIAVIAAAVVASGLTAGAIAVFGGGGGSSHAAARPPSGATTTVAKTLNGPAAELLALIATGNKGSWHARYSDTTVSSTQTTDASGGAVTLVEIWRKPPSVRQDIVQTVGGTVLQHTESFVLPAGPVACAQQAGAGPWLCTPASSAQAAGPDAVLRQMAQQLTGVPVTARDDNLSGRPVRCFDATMSGRPVRLCLTRDGVPALAITATAELQLQTLDGNIAASVFTPPAPVASA
jgi:hypothetical protein